MNAKSMLENEGRKKAVAGAEQTGQQDPTNTPVEETIIQRLKRLVKGPRPLWPIPRPDTKQATNRQ